MAPPWIDSTLTIMKNNTVDGLTHMYSESTGGYFWALIYSMFMLFMYMKLDSDAIVAGAALLIGGYIIIYEDPNPVVQPFIVIIMVLTLAMCLWRAQFRK